jgi:hypothetical protein
MTQNIEWMQVSDKDNVIITGKPGSQFYLVNGTHVPYWGSHDSRRAQRYLAQLANKNAANN